LENDEGDSWRDDIKFDLTKTGCEDGTGSVSGQWRASVLFIMNVWFLVTQVGKLLL
jgi:hypothetical protein